jgi:hypothetical protein
VNEKTGSSGKAGRRMLRLLSRGRKVRDECTLTMDAPRSLACLAWPDRPSTAHFSSIQGQEGGEDDHKKYKKANLGKSNQMYYNDEVGRECSSGWVLPFTSCS